MRRLRNKTRALSRKRAEKCQENYESVYGWGSGQRLHHVGPSESLIPESVHLRRLYALRPVLAAIRGAELNHTARTPDLWQLTVRETKKTEPRLVEKWAFFKISNQNMWAEVASQPHPSGVADQIWPRRTGQIPGRDETPRGGATLEFYTRNVSGDPGYNYGLPTPTSSTATQISIYPV